MPTNRLKLDFSLQTNVERNEFLQKYLLQPQFETTPPTEDEIETMANYLLWGKNPKTGLNAKQENNIKLKTKHGTWDSDGRTESLEALLESPTFSETSLLREEGCAVQKIKKEKFSREEALAKCPSSMRVVFKDLFALIDRTELMINYYELAHNKRTNPPRDFLLRKFTEEEQEALREKVTHWNQYKYLRARHNLVEMRREQYTLKDYYSSPALCENTTSAICEYDRTVDFEGGIEVLPLGLRHSPICGNLIFKNEEHLNPTSFAEPDLKIVSDFYWKKHNYKPTGTEKFFDFRNLEHVYSLLNLLSELREDAEDAEFDSALPALLETLNYYINLADLTDIHKEILQMKINKNKNADIAFAVNKKWGKSYTPNYISTIFRQRIIPRINAAADYHEEIISKIFFPEEFKKCSLCGRQLLKNTRNFIRKSRSHDGFSARCKMCEGGKK